MRVSVSRIASDVAALLGESLSLECQAEECPFPDMEERVRIIAPSLLTRILLDSGLYLSNYVKSFPASWETDNSGGMSAVLPDDFLRLASVKMKHWNRPVTNVSEETSGMLSRQSNRWEGVKANADRPLGVIGFDASGRHALKVFPAEAGDGVEFAYYISRPVFDASGNLEAPEGLYETLVKEVATEIHSPE